MKPAAVFCIRCAQWVVDGMCGCVPMAWGAMRLGGRWVVLGRRVPAPVGVA